MDKDRAFISKRTGFIRLCLQYGVAVRPVFVFGENSCYWNIQGMFSTRLALNRYGIPTILPWGHAIIPLLPKSSVDLRVIVGDPIALPRVKDPSKDEVNLWHGRYVAALTKLYEQHKESAYGPDKAKTSKLEIW